MHYRCRVAAVGLAGLFYEPCWLRTANSKEESSGDKPPEAGVAPVPQKGGTQ
jgi:hypothetical protein